jgi:hypothetical protein
MVNENLCSGVHVIDYLRTTIDSWNDIDRRIQMNDKEAAEILDTMKIPEGRKKDWEWLRRNLAIRNREHPQFSRVFMFILSKVAEKK